MTMTQPTKQSHSFTSQKAGAETILYNHDDNKAYCLNRVSAAVWELCDGKRSIEGIAEAATLELQTSVTPELAGFTVLELRKKGLLAAAVEPEADGRMTRRALALRFGVGAAMMPVVFMMSVKPKVSGSIVITI